jgi:hypothetical protein
MFCSPGYSTLPVWALCSLGQRWSSNLTHNNWTWQTLGITQFFSKYWHPQSGHRFASFYRW